MRRISIQLRVERVVAVERGQQQVFCLRQKRLFGYGDQTTAESSASSIGKRLAEGADTHTLR